jgi:serine/threonine protein kinase
MSNIIRLTATDGSPVEFVDQVIGQGGMKDVYFSPDKSYVVAFFRKPQDFNAKDRLTNIVTTYRERIFNQEGGSYYSNLYCWPTHIVEYKGLLGLKAPTYPKHFFFQHGSRNSDMLGIKGKEKEGKWFSTGTHQQKWLDERERGNWRDYFQVCVRIARATARLHRAGLAHSDLSYKNVLIDPVSGNAAVIDIDGLVVPGKFPPDVVGTPDFIAPEVMATLKLPLQDKGKCLPRIETDRHALAVLIYMYLLYRHPLKGGIVHPVDIASKDPEGERLSLEMGSKALFIEHPTDTRNRPNIKVVKKGDLPYADVTKIPYTILGPHLKALFDRAFIDGLHKPQLRPTGDDWVTALLQTVDLMQPCSNPSCIQKWYVFDNSTKPKCPFCGTPYAGTLPVLNLYSSYGKGTFKPENRRLMVYTNQYIYQWHVNRNVFPNERLTDEQKKPVGYFSFHGGKWLFVNQTLSAMKDVSANKPVPLGSALELVDGQQILLSPDDGGRLLQVQMVKG